MKILLIRFSALGDVAMLAALVREIAHERPMDEFTVLSMPNCAPLFDNIAPNVIFLGKNVKRDYKGIFGLKRLFNELNGYGKTKSNGGKYFDYICDMHDVLRTKILRKFFILHGYKVSKIDKHRNLRKQITAQGDKKQLIQIPTSFQNYIEALKPIVPIENIDTIASIATVKTSTTIGIAPFAAHEGKIYPLDKMERVIELLKGKDVILFGGGGNEREVMQQWAQKYPWVHLASETHKGLREELKLMKELDVMVSMDSANMHLASFVGTRVVSIWGATHPFAGFLGWGQSMDDCVQLDLPCRPCSIYGNKKCIYSDHRCMNGITPEMVVQRIETSMMM